MIRYKMDGLIYSCLFHKHLHMKERVEERKKRFVFKKKKKKKVKDIGFEKQPAGQTAMCVAKAAPKCGSACSFTRIQLHGKKIQISLREQTQFYWRGLLYCQVTIPYVCSRFVLFRRIIIVHMWQHHRTLSTYFLMGFSKI